MLRVMRWAMLMAGMPLQVLQLSRRRQRHSGCRCRKNSWSSCGPTAESFDVSIPSWSNSAVDCGRRHDRSAGMAVGAMAAAAATADMPRMSAPRAAAEGDLRRRKLRSTNASRH